jgi:hemerythrin
MATATNVLFPWSQKYQVGIGFVDTQHKQLVDIINRLHQAMHSGKGKEVLGKTLEELIQYTKSHFAAEEKVLQSSGYPEFPAHRAEHERLTFTVLEFHQKLMSNEIGLSLNVMDFLKDWLGQHILHVDMKYAPYLKEKGVE